MIIVLILDFQASGAPSEPPGNFLGCPTSVLRFATHGGSEKAAWQFWLCQKSLSCESRETKRVAGSTATCHTESINTGRYYLSCLSVAWAAANRAIGTR
jgi:hypothetical protein